MAPLCYRRHAARRCDRQLCFQLAQPDEIMMADIQRVWHAKWYDYGAHKVWLQTNREGVVVVCCTVDRLMRHGPAGSPPG